MDNYYNRPEVSNSDLSALKKELYGGPDYDPTRAYANGNLIDAMITEENKVNYIARTCLDVDYEFTIEEFEKAREMKKAFLKDELCRMMLSKSTPQAVMVVRNLLFDYDAPFRLDVRCKWDLWMQSLGWGGDIKSTAAETQEQFIAACKFFDYDRSRFWYMNIAEAKYCRTVEKDILIGISKTAIDRKTGLPKIFKLPITKGDDFYNSGKEKALELAFQWWLRFGDVA